MPQPVPGSNYPQPTQQELDQRAVAQLLYQHSKPWSERYSEWGEEHPYEQFGLETATNLIPWSRVIKRIPGLGTIGDILHAAESVGGLGGFGEGAEYIKDPKLALDKDESMSSGTSDMYDLRSTETNKKLGYLSVSPEKATRQLHVNMATNIYGGEGKYNTGQYLHILRQEARDRYPDMDWLRFFRTSGAGPKNRKGKIIDVTMPLRRYDEMSPEGKKMYDQFVARYGTPIRRVRLGGPGPEESAHPEDDAAAAAIAERISGESQQRNEQLRQYGDEIARQVGRPWSEEPEE